MRKEIYEELIAEGHERKYVDWYLFCLSQHQPEENIMDDREEQETISAGRLIYLIDKAHIMGEKLAGQIARGVGGREIALSLTKLEEARHRAVDAKTLLEGHTMTPQDLVKITGQQEAPRSTQIQGLH